MVAVQAGDWRRALQVALRAIALDKSVPPTAELKTVSFFDH
jgi:hypothetical protein